jgi:hypothetical protein
MSQPPAPAKIARLRKAKAQPAPAQTTAQPALPAVPAQARCLNPTDPIELLTSCVEYLLEIVNKRRTKNRLTLEQIKKIVSFPQKPERPKKEAPQSEPKPSNKELLDFLLAKFQLDKEAVIHEMAL